MEQVGFGGRVHHSARGVDDHEAGALADFGEVVDAGLVLRQNRVIGSLVTGGVGGVGGAEFLRGPNKGESAGNARHIADALACVGIELRALGLRHRSHRRHRRALDGAIAEARPDEVHRAQRRERCEKETEHEQQ